MYTLPIHIYVGLIEDWLGLASLAAVHVLSCRLHACGQHGTVPMAAPAMLAHHRQLYVPIL